MRNNSTKKIVRLALFLALGVVLNIIESMLPVLIAVPGVKLGIANTIPGALSPAQRATGGKNTPYRLTFIAQPCFMFRKYSDPTKVGSAGAGYEALGMMNLIPNKNECASLGFFDKWFWDPEKDMRCQSWETLLRESLQLRTMNTRIRSKRIMRLILMILL